MRVLLDRTEDVRSLTPERIGGVTKLTVADAFISLPTLVLACPDLLHEQ